MSKPHAWLVGLLTLGTSGLFGQVSRPGLGAISGRVLDPDGQPVQGIAVSAVGASGSSMEQTSEPDGFYRLYDLPAGTYRIRAVPQTLHLPPEIRSDGSNEVRFGTTFHPSTLSADSAADVAVEAGGEKAGIDIRLLPKPIVAVRGTVSGIPAGMDYLGIVTRKMEPGRAPNTGRGGPMIRPSWNGDRVNADGTFAVWGLDPGTYILMVNTNGGRFSSAPVQVEVANKDVSGIVIQMAGQSDLSGRVVPGDDGARIPIAPPNASLGQSPQINLREFRGNLLGYSVVAGDGTFRVTNLAPGKYYVRLSWGAYVERMKLGSRDIEGSVLDLENGAGSEPLTVTASTATAQVSGTVRNASVASANKMVLLMSDDIPVLQLSSAIRADGAYAIRNVPPGKYNLFVLDSRFFNGIQPADYADIAEKVEIHSGDRVSRDLRQHADVSK